MLAQQRGLDLIGMLEKQEIIKAFTRDAGFTTIAKEDIIKERRCSVCQKPSSDLKKCGRCGARYYCRTLCQLEDWTAKGHKEQCKWLRESRKKTPS